MQRSLQCFSTSIRRADLAVCSWIEDENARSANDKAEMATVLNIDPKNYAATFCKRLVNGMASGRITYQDYVNLRSSTADSSRFIRVMQKR